MAPHSCMKAGLRALLLLVLAAPIAGAQDHPPEHQHAAPAASNSAWTWSADATVFGGFNYQRRRYVDFASWESQNWLMVSGERAVTSGRLQLQTMLSLEPLTVGRYVYIVGSSTFRAGGSPQLFQTGETFDRLPLVDYQHPHDLIMGLGATYRIERERLTYTIGGDLVGSPTLGPPPFMHRASAQNNPQVPLGHHLLDSTHSSAGVVRAGIGVSAWTVEASAFRGEEPDEHRYDLDRPRLDSWAARAGWRHGPWQAQLSGGRLHRPEWFEPFDHTSITASGGFTGAVGSFPLAATVAWGESREYTPNRTVTGALLAEWDVGVTATLATYGRAESTRKEHFRHLYVPGFPHPHYLSDVSALTIGGVQDLMFAGLDQIGRFGIGGDVTVYRMSPDLAVLYGGSVSYHVFLRWRPSHTAAHTHQ